MTRPWDEFAAALFDRVAPGLALLILLALAGIVAALWYWFPAWVPRSLPRIKAPRWKMPRRKTKKPRETPKKDKTAPAEVKIAPPAETRDTHLADNLAAEGRYAEAIRQRLRDVVGDLTEAGVVAPLPGTTATEVAATVVTQRPAVAVPLSGATRLFEEVWYGNRPAGRNHDDHMRELTGEVRKRMTGDAR